MLARGATVPALAAAISSLASALTTSFRRQVDAVTIARAAMKPYRCATRANAKRLSRRRRRAAGHPAGGAVSFPSLFSLCRSQSVSGMKQIVAFEIVKIG
jgi:hypothetical protein